MEDAIGLIAGAKKRLSCGVTDYAGRLKDALSLAGQPAVLVNAVDWSLSGWWRLVAQARQFVLIHLQYPSLAFEKRIGPYLLFIGLLGRRRVLTMHEFSRKSRWGKLAAVPMLLLAHLIIVTSEQERQSVTRYLPSITSKINVVHLASNIPEWPEVVTRDIDVIYFGQIRAARGLEQFLEVAALLGSDRIVEIVGAVAPEDPEGAVLIQNAQRQGVKVTLNLPPESVAQVLARSRVALLPFPDGITERRGSALAAMLNGALLVTTRNEQADTFDDLALLGNNSADLAVLTKMALDVPERFEEVRMRSRQFARSRSWQFIAAAHLRLYAMVQMRKSRWPSGAI